jgi:hypothetical protein
VLLRDPEVFRRYYEPSLSLDETDVVPTNLHQLLARDQYRMTQLDRAAFRGDVRAVDRILQTLRHSLSPTETNQEVKKTAKEVVDDLVFRESQDFTSFFVAAAFGHEEICRKLLVFFKELVNMKVLPLKQLQDFYVAPNGMIYKAAQLAIRFVKLPMFRVILTSVKQIMRQRPLVCLVKEFTNNSREWFKTLTEIVIDGTEGTTGCQHLNEIVFHDSDTLESISIIEEETFNKMMSAMGVQKWIKKFFSVDTIRGIQVLTRHHLDHFDRSQMLDFLTVYTASQGPFNSIWYHILNFDVAKDDSVFRYPDFEYDFDKILECAAAKLGREELRNLLFDPQGVVLIIRSIFLSLLDYGEKSLVNRLLDSLKVGEQDETIELLMDNMPSVITYVMKPFKERHSRKEITQARMKVLDFILEHPDYCYDDLPKIAEAMLSEHEDYGGVKRNIWSYIVHLDSVYSLKEMSDKLLKLVNCLCTSPTVGK